MFLGLSSGLSSSPAWAVEGNDILANFGYVVATAGDVNGDGYADVIVGAPFYGSIAPDRGTASVYLGSALGLSTSAAWLHSEEDLPSARFGSSVSTAGDVDGDGYSDVIVGGGHRVLAEHFEGRAYVFRGSSTGLEPTATCTADADDGAVDPHPGSATVAAGDVNGDGYSDVIVGFPSNTHETGLVAAYHGSAWGLASSQSWRKAAIEHGDRFGFSVSTAGDVNGDGFSDVLVGSPATTTVRPMKEGPCSTSARRQGWPGSPLGVQRVTRMPPPSEARSEQPGTSTPTATPT